MTSLEILSMAGMSVVFAFIELIIDRDLDKAFKADGDVTELENDLLHGKFMYVRGFVLLLISMNFTQGITMMGAGVIFCASVFWLIFDILAAKMWLNKEWHYLGTTSKIDGWMKTPWHLIIKTILILAFGAILLHGW